MNITMGWAARTAIAATLVALPAIAIAQSATVKGLITARNGDQLTVTSQDGTKSTFTLSGATVVKAAEGGLGLRKEAEPVSALVPGLPVAVSATGSAANSITFKASDLKTADMIQAGVAQEDENLQAQATANALATANLKSDVANINKFDIKGSATVLFATNSRALTAAGQQQLLALAKQAKAMPAYMISVVGYTDSTGKATYNTKLSGERASAVTTFLEQKGGIPPYRMLSPGALAAYDPAASNESASGKADNRRVTVQIMVSKGLENM